MRHFLSFDDFTKEEILEIIKLGADIKKEAKSICLGLRGHARHR